MEFFDFTEENRMSSVLEIDFSTLNIYKAPPVHYMPLAPFQLFPFLEVHTELKKPRIKVFVTEFV